MVNPAAAGRKPAAAGMDTAAVASLDESLRAAIMTLVQARGTDKTVCPSEAARAVAAQEFRALMPAVRAAAAALAAEGRIEITQGGRVVDARSARGPIRLRLASATTAPPPSLD